MFILFFIIVIFFQRRLLLKSTIRGFRVVENVFTAVNGATRLGWVWEFRLEGGVIRPTVGTRKKLMYKTGSR